MISKGWRTSLVCGGIALAWASKYLPYSYGEPYDVIQGYWVYTYQDVIVNWWLLSILSVGAIVSVLLGCYIWTRLKNRHWAFMFWGLLAPIGLLGISLLRDKSGGEINDNR